MKNTVTEGFDPFGLKGETFSPLNSTDTNPSKKRVPTLPAKCEITLILHEEITSSATGKEKGGSEARANIVGSLHARLVCSNARRNLPFELVSESSEHEANFDNNSEYVDRSIVTIPKGAVGNVLITSYTSERTIKSMPILVQSRFSTFSKTCRITVQVRSNLSNQGDLSMFSIALAMPPFVKNVKVTKGDGTWDGLRRLVKWTRSELPKGHSFAVSVEGEMLAPVKPEDHTQHNPFPVIIRCESSVDHLSGIEFDAIQVEGHPATIIVKKFHSFRLLHRVT